MKKLLFIFLLCGCAPFFSLVAPNTPFADPARLTMTVSSNGADFALSNNTTTPILDTVVYVGAATEVSGLPRCAAQSNGIGCVLGDIPPRAVVRFTAKGTKLSAWASYERGTELIPANPAQIAQALPAATYTPPSTVLGVNLYPPAPVAVYLEALQKFPMIKAVQTSDVPTAIAMKQAGYVVGAFACDTPSAITLARAAVDYIYICDENNYTQTPEQYLEYAKPIVAAVRATGYTGDIVSSAVGNITKPVLGIGFIQAQQADSTWLEKFIKLESGVFDAIAANPFDGEMATYKRVFTSTVPRRNIYHAGWAFQNPENPFDLTRGLVYALGGWGTEFSTLRLWHKVKVSAFWCLGESGGGNWHSRAWGLINLETKQLTSAGSAVLQYANGWK